MTSDESDAISRFNLDDDDDDDLPQRSYWWSLHRPETYAITALAIAVVTLISLAPAEEIARAILFTTRENSERTLLIVLSSIRLGVALFATFAAVLSIRSEDEDTGWSAPVARAALLLAAVSIILAAAALVTSAFVPDPTQPTF